MFCRDPSGYLVEISSFDERGWDETRTAEGDYFESLTGEEGKCTVCGALGTVAATRPASASSHHHRAARAVARAGSAGRQTTGRPPSGKKHAHAAMSAGKL